LQQLSHPYILKIIDVYEDENYYIYTQDSTVEGKKRVAEITITEEQVKNKVVTLIDAL
jgi:hypothetical protein